jgi:hypothetical protein
MGSFRNVIPHDGEVDTMAMEPMTLFARIANPAAVARLLRERAPSADIDGPDDSWRQAVISLGQGTITFTHDPAYYSEPNWSVQMNGMRGYFSHFPETDRKARALLLPTTFKFSLGLLFDPDYDPDGDARLDIVYAVTELLDGVLFTPSSFRDARGRVLYGAGGEDEEDAEAAWPRVIAEVNIADAPRAPTSEPDQTQPPAPARVARRALALTAVTARAILEQGSVNLGLDAPGWNPITWVRHLMSGQQRQHQNLLAWIQLLGIDDEFEPDEWEALQRPPGRLDQTQQINSTWRLEGLGVLAWALGRFTLPTHDQLVECHSLWRSLGILDVAACKGMLVQPTLRPRGEIESLRKRLFALHWRLTDFFVQPKVIDFAEFARTAWFGPLDISGFPLQGGDLAIGGARIDEASPEALGDARSIAHERHLAANWLLEGPERYSEASANT